MDNFPCACSDVIVTGFNIYIKESLLMIILMLHTL